MTLTRVEFAPTIDALLYLLTLLSALGCGLIAGVFLAFSAFIMKALTRVAPAQGILAMQSINIVVINPWFLGVFFGNGAPNRTVRARPPWRPPAPVVSHRAPGR